MSFRRTNFYLSTQEAHFEGIGATAPGCKFVKTGGNLKCSLQKYFWIHLEMCKPKSFHVKMILCWLINLKISPKNNCITITQKQITQTNDDRRVIQINILYDTAAWRSLRGSSPQWMSVYDHRLVAGSTTSPNSPMTTTTEESRRNGELYVTTHQGLQFVGHSPTTTSI